MVAVPSERSPCNTGLEQMKGLRKTDAHQGLRLLVSIFLLQPAHLTLADQKVHTDQGQQHPVAEQGSLWGYGPG